MFEAADANDLEFAMVVSHGGTSYDNDAEERSARVASVHILG